MTLQKDLGFIMWGIIINIYKIKKFSGDSMDIRLCYVAVECITQLIN